MHEEWVLLETVGIEDEARLIVGFLQSVDIECQIESLRFTQEPVNFGHLSEMRLRVRHSDLEMARELLAQQRQGGGSTDEGEDPTGE